MWPVTALNAYLGSDGAIVLADTLATTADLQPVGFTSKIYPVLHLGAVISGRGSHDLISGYARHVMGVEPIRDFDDLVERTPGVLTLGAKILEGWWPGPSTVYLWGWSAADGRFRGYAFSSRADFETRALPEGFMTAPGLENADELAALLKNEDALVALADVMRAAHDEQAKRSDDERCAIGGDIVACILSLNDAGAPLIQSSVVHRFSSWRRDYDSMVAYLGGWDG